jgi:WhiB family redox-sensing transcriptional regulator
MFFAEKFGFDIADSFGYGDQKQVAEAKNMCNTICEIRDACLEYALKHNETHGVWGGTSPRERMIMLRKQRGRMSEVDARLLERDGDE